LRFSLGSCFSAYIDERCCAQEDGKILQQQSQRSGYDCCLQIRRHLHAHWLFTWAISASKGGLAASRGLRAHNTLHVAFTRLVNVAAKRKSTGTRLTARALCFRQTEVSCGRSRCSPIPAITVQGCRLYDNVELRRCCTMIPPVQRFAYRRYLKHVYAVNW